MRATFRANKLIKVHALAGGVLKPAFRFPVVWEGLHHNPDVYVVRQCDLVGSKLREIFPDRPMRAGADYAVPGLYALDATLQAKAWRLVSKFPSAAAGRTQTHIVRLD